MIQEKLSRPALLLCLVAITLVEVLYYRSQQPTILASHKIYDAHQAKISIEELSGDLKDLNSRYLETIPSSYPLADPSLSSTSARILATLQEIQTFSDESPRQRFYVTHLDEILAQELASLQQSLNRSQISGKSSVSLPHSVDSPNGPFMNSLHLVGMILEEQDRLIMLKHNQLVSSIHTQSILWEVLIGWCIVTGGVLIFWLWGMRNTPP